MVVSSTMFALAIKLMNYQKVELIGCLVFSVKYMSIFQPVISQNSIFSINHRSFLFQCYGPVFSLDSLLREFQTFSNFITGCRATDQKLLKSYPKH